MSTANEYNERELERGNIHADDISAVTLRAQKAYNHDRRFMRVPSLDEDGKLGPTSRATFNPKQTGTPIIEPIAPFKPLPEMLRKFRLTSYWIGDAKRGSIPMRDPKGKIIAHVSPGSFVEAALEGTARIRATGQLVNVSGWRKIPITGIYHPILKIARRNNWIPAKAGYAGIRVGKQHGDSYYIKQVRTFKPIKAGPNGWPIWKGIEASPFRTLAADIGLLRKHSSRYKGKGGLVPVGTRVFIKEFVGVDLPDGTTHDGWFVVNDTGGGIYGCHFDVFAGSRKWAKTRGLLPKYVTVWFEGIEDRIGADYNYGLKK